MRYIIKDMNEFKKRYKDYNITKRKMNGIDTYIINEAKSSVIICWDDDRKIGSGTLFRYCKIFGTYNSDIDGVYIPYLIRDGLVIEKHR